MTGEAVAPSRRGFKSADEDEGRAQDDEDRPAGRSEMGKPVRNTSNSGLQPSNCGGRGPIRSRHNATGTGPHTATPDNNRMPPIYQPPLKEKLRRPERVVKVGEQSCADTGTPPA